jgi:lysozyme
MMPNRPGKRGLAAIVGSVAAASLLVFTPAQEGTVYATYKDLGGVLTYCTGATEDAQWGKTYTPAECAAQLDRDLERHAAGIAKCVSMDRLTDGQKVAFVDAAFNIGVANFCSSSMARKANAGDMVGACNALLLWNKVGNREVAGLTKRRQRERELCLKGLT